jgi:hypothetical protein
MIEEFKKIDFHDASIENLKMDFNNSQICIKIAEYDDTIDEYKYKVLSFFNVTNIHFENFKFEFLEFESIYSSVFDEENLRVNFTFLQGASRPSSGLYFNFKTVLVKTDRTD